MTLRLNGSSSGFTEIDAPAAAGSNTFVLPTSNGSPEQFLKNSGTAGTLEFSSMVETSTGIGIGTSSPSQQLHLSGASPRILLTETTDNSNAFLDAATSGVLEFSADDNNVAASSSMRFKVDGSEHMRILNDGDILMGKLSSDLAVGGFEYFDNTGNEHVDITNTRSSGGECLNLNRQTSDGSLITFWQASTVEGNITVSGSTVSYNGAHLSRWSQLAGGAERTEILRGTVLSNLDEMCEWAYEAQDAVLYTEEDELPEGASVGDVKKPAVAAGTEDNEQLNRMKVSDVEGDVNVAGVFQDWDADDVYPNDFYCAMTGDFVIRIAQGTTVARGDLLMSAGDGTAKPQDDDIVRSKTIAKVTSTTVSTTYSDGSYCVPCVLMAC